MRLSELLKKAGVVDKEAFSMRDIDITSIVYDSRKAGKGSLFVALPGVRLDGRAFVKDALERGASAVLAEGEINGINVPGITVSDARLAMASASNILYGEPSKALKLTGVTGTNGKTTTTYLVESIIASSGLSAGVIGTVNYRYAGKCLPAPHTTPEAPDLQGLLRDMRSSGVTHAIMEVSSHALAQKRVWSVSFDAAIFTNLTPEHLDYHKTMEAYFDCKAVLFRELIKPGGRAVINIDDRWGSLLASSRGLGSALTFSLKGGAGIYPMGYVLNENGIEGVVKTPAGDVEVASGLVGEYNLQNILGAIGAGVVLGFKPSDIARGITALRRVPGRLERIDYAGQGGPFAVYVDYAHTGDALERALSALKAITKGRVITVFGCGGDRDREKRPVMGEIASRLSAITIITSDNPRGEEPLDIIKEVVSGIKGVDMADGGPLGERCYMVIPDRKDAIRKAVSAARHGDAVLVAGKGHEGYQIVKGVEYPFDDFKAVEECMNELGGAGAK